MSGIKSLVAIYNIFDGIEMLPYSLESIHRNIDHVIIIFQQKSNFGEFKDTRSELYDVIKNYPSDFISVYEYEPNISLGGTANETMKRNSGLKLARKKKFTHFFFVDCDEAYANFAKAKLQYIESCAEGSVCEMYTYFKRPTWRLQYIDNYYVPFIHQLHPHTVAGARNYKFYCDPTRSVNCESVTLIKERMHHFSWVRRDIEMKARNSSARDNIAASHLMNDYNALDVGPGYYVTDYRQELIEVENIFNIPWPL